MKKWFFKFYAWGTGRVFNEFWIYKVNNNFIHTREPRVNFGKFIGKHYEITNK